MFCGTALYGDMCTVLLLSMVPVGREPSNTGRFYIVLTDVERKTRSKDPSQIGDRIWTKLVDRCAMLPSKSQKASSVLSAELLLGSSWCTALLPPLAAAARR